MALMITGDAEPGVPVLLVEDDDQIGRHVLDGLTAAGYQVHWCRTGESALAEATRSAPDTVVLDLGLPDTDGIEIARTLRTRHPSMLIVILTARGEDIDVVIGLDAGADDYLVKPFSMSVLLARLRAHHRVRVQHAGQPDLTVGPLHIDLASRRCFLDDLEIALRPKEFDLLAVLLSRAGTVVSREELMAEVWDVNWFGSTKTLDVTMAALRRAMAAASDRAAPVITTLRGRGYRLETEAESQV